MSRRPDTATRLRRAADALGALTLADLASLPSSVVASLHLLSAQLTQSSDHRDWTKQVHPEVRALVMSDNRIGAIKKQRELTSMGLAEAKDFVDSHFKWEVSR